MRTVLLMILMLAVTAAWIAVCAFGVEALRQVLLRERERYPEQYEGRVGRAIVWLFALDRAVKRTPPQRRRRRPY